MRKRVYETTNTVTDCETGEIKSITSTEVFKTKGEGAYVKLYLEDFLKLHDVPIGPRCLFLALLDKIDFHGNIFLNKALKDQMSEKLGIKDQTFRSYLLSLTKAGLLEGKGGGLYVMNPAIAAKGDGKHVLDLRKKFNILVKYNKTGRKITLEQ